MCLFDKPIACFAFGHVSPIGFSMGRRVSMNPTMLPLLGLMPFPMHARAHAIRRLLRRLLKRLKLRAIWRTLVKLCACWEGHEKERQQEQNDNLHLCLDYAGTRGPVLDLFDVLLHLLEHLVMDVSSGQCSSVSNQYAT